jgi:hypothetical protein
MAVLEGGVSTALMGVGEEDIAPAHFTQKPVPYGARGHYRSNHRCALIAAQAANSRLFSFRNPHATELCTITRLVLKWIQTAAHTAAIEDSLDVFKVTSFSVVDTTNTVTPGVSYKRGTMAVTPNAVLRGVTVAGAAAGMTGGTLTKDGTSVGQLPKWFVAAVPTASEVKTDLLDVFDDVNGTHPFVFAQNEGLIIENRVLLGAAAGSGVYVDISWAVSLKY